MQIEARVTDYADNGQLKLVKKREVEMRSRNQSTTDRAEVGSKEVHHHPSLH
jgi:hypothetical protein